MAYAYHLVRSGPSALLTCRSNHSPAFGTLGLLPPELRLRIYQLVLGRFDMQHGKLLYIHSHMSPQYTTGTAYRAVQPEPEPAILSASKVIRHEAATIYYQHCKIIIDVSQNRTRNDRGENHKGLKSATSWLNFITGPMTTNPGSSIPLEHVHIEFIVAIRAQFPALLDLLKFMVRNKSCLHIIGGQTIPYVNKQEDIVVGTFVGRQGEEREIRVNLHPTKPKYTITMPNADSVAMEIWHEAVFLAVRAKRDAWDERRLEAEFAPLAADIAKSRKAPKKAKLYGYDVRHIGKRRR